MKLISWNVNRSSIKRFKRQLAALQERRPEVVALQEVGKAAGRNARQLLREFGFPYGVHSHDFLDGKAPHSSGIAIGSHWPFRVLDPDAFDIPYPQRILSAELFAPFGRVEVHSAHVVPGSQYGWDKIDMLEGIHEYITDPYEHGHRVLCGDFNTPKTESPDGEVTFWGQNRDQRWADAERSVVLGLAEHDLADAFRLLNGYDNDAHSFVLRRKEKEWKRRFDHVFSSKSLNPVEASYLHQHDEHSDHSPMEVVFEPIGIDSSVPTEGAN
ncbi:MAG: endonuclease/exonuclease/phosphatase family protein [Persicimonas sp.]